MSQASDFVIQGGMLLEYRGTSGTVVVPKGVIGIPSNVFRKSDVEEVVLPEGLEWLGDSALSECPRLKRLVLPGTLRVVPDSLCWRSQALEEVVIPEGVVFLDHAAFSKTGLRSVTIPGSVRSIGFTCFGSCKQLETVTLKEGLQTLQSDAFRFCASLRSISFPDSLKVIGFQAFRGCRNLESVRMGRSLRFLDAFVFRDCPRLRKLDLPETLEILQVDAFGEDSALERLTLAGNRAVILPPQYTSKPVCPAPVIRAPRMLPQWFPAASRAAALKGYQELKAEGWPLTPEIVEAWEAFAAGADPDAPEKWAGPFRVVDGILCGVANPDGRVAVPDGIVGIRAEVFQGTAVREVWFPDSVDWIQIGTFEGCRQLREVRLPAGLTRIPDRLFYGCWNLRSIRIPDGVTQIDPDAFTEAGLETLDLPDRLESIDEFAFFKCGILRQVRFPAGLREIWPYAFSKADSLTEAVLPDSLVFLADGVFTDCTDLKRVSTGAGLRHLQTETFENCYNLREVVVSADQCSISDNCFKDCSDALQVRMEGFFADLGTEGMPARIFAPNADPSTLNEDSLRPVLLGFLSKGGLGFRCEAQYLETLRIHRRKVWDSEEILRFLLRRDMLEREDIPDRLRWLQERNDPDLVAELLEYGHRRFPEPAAPPFLE